MNKETGARTFSRRTLPAGMPVVVVSAASLIGPTTAAHAAVSSRGITVINEFPPAGRFRDFSATDGRDDVVRSLCPGDPAGRLRPEPRAPYPVSLLLHGGHPEGVDPAQRFPGPYLDWTEHGGIADQQTVGKDVIIVCPGGDNGGFYVNWKGP
ncbi:MAG: hypothetical protein M3Y35_09645 [Actinomycetota bacterium]|nr:hypothetical protein [Actinomycetota bacterium]